MSRVLNLWKSWIVKHSHRSYLSPKAFKSISHYNALYNSVRLDQSCNDRHIFASSFYRSTNLLVLHLRWNYLLKINKAFLFLTTFTGGFVRLPRPKKVSFVYSDFNFIVLWCFRHQIRIFKFQLELNLLRRVRNNTCREFQFFVLIFFLL